MRAIRLLLIAALALAPSFALAQSTLLQGGSFSGGRVPMYANQGSGSGSQTVVQDSGAASGGGAGLGLSELLLAARGTGTAPYAGQGTGPLGTNFCDYDAPTTNATGYHYLCMSANAQGGGLVAYGAGGAASQLPLTFNVNGTAYQFPFTTSGVVGPSSSVVNDAACWNNTAGTLLKDCGAFVTVGGNNTWTGTNNFTGTFQIGSVTQTFPASGNIVGTSDTQSLTNKSINAAEVNSGTLACNQMPGLTGNVTSAAGACSTTIANGVVTTAMLAASTQNTVKGAATSTTVADLPLPSCSSAGNALQWTANTGFNCATLSAQTAGWGLALSAGTLSIATAQPPYGYDVPINLGLTASVGASALTINLTGANGSAPSATNPVSIPFRSTTLATGTPSWAIVTSALSIIVPSAATLGTSNGVAFRIWIFAAYNAGVPELGVAVCSVPTQIFPCAGWEFTRKTSITIDGFATSAGVLYATSGVSNDSIRIIGYADYASGLATAGSYASTPTTLQVFGPGIKRPGEVVQQSFGQITTATSTANTYTISNTIPTTSNGGVAIAAPALTATSTANLYRVQAQALLANGTTAHYFAFLYNGTAMVATAAGFGSTTNTIGTVPISYLTQAASGSTNYTLYFGGAGGTTYLNSTAGSTSFGGTADTNITVQEIMGALPEPANDNIDPGVYSMTG